MHALGFHKPMTTPVQADLLRLAKAVLMLAGPVAWRMIKRPGRLERMHFI